MAQKKYNGAPFGTQTARFDISGVHPQNKMPGTYTQVPYCKKATSKENKLLGPGTYSTEMGDFTPRAIKEKMNGPNWERAYQEAKLAGIPHMLYRKQWKHKKQLIELLGPGRYNTKDIIQEMNSRPSSNRGICQTKDTRFGKENKFHSNLPGPGTYGKGGVPWALMQEKEKQSTSTVGMMESGGNHVHSSKTVGSGLAPGQYTYTNSIEQLLNKTISKRGPYDLFTEDRYKPSKVHTQTKHLGPGKYALKSFTDNWNDHHQRKHGRFSTVPQYPHPPTERIYCSTLSQCPRNKTDPGPGHYVGERVNSAPSMSRYPFSSSAKRFNKRTQKFSNPVGSGQYDLHRWQNSQHVNGNTSVFVSITPRLVDLNAPRELLLNERIHPKGIPLHIYKRQFVV